MSIISSIKKLPLKQILATTLLLGVVLLTLFLLDADVIIIFSFIWLVIIALLLWVGNRILSRALDKLMPWASYGNWRFFTHLLVGLSYLLLIINVIYFGIRLLLINRAPTIEQVVVMNTWGAAIFIPVFSLYFSLYFLRYWRETEVRREKAEKEKIRSQLDSLKNHLDPHFLFNNLNILASLVDKDTRASKMFIEKFAEVYRTLLKTKSDDLVLVGDEMSFIQSYMYLIHVRFENNIQLQTELSASVKNKLIPPLTLQMLVENAIKHNLISEERPLLLKLYDRDGYLCLRNSVFHQATVNTTGSGLANIRERFAHFTDKPVLVENNPDYFEVKIPLLEVETV